MTAVLSEEGTGGGIQIHVQMTLLPVIPKKGNLYLLT